MTSGTFTFPQNTRQGGQHHRGQSIRSSGYPPLAVNAAVRAQTQEPDKYGLTTGWVVSLGKIYKYSEPQCLDVQRWAISTLYIGLIR